VSLCDFQNTFSKRGVLKISEQERGESFENLRAISKMLQAFSNRRVLKISERSEVIFEYPKNLVDFCDSEVRCQ